MPDLTCPACAAAVPDDIADRTGRSTCPDCGADLSPLLDVSSREPHNAEDNDDESEDSNGAAEAGFLNSDVVQVIEQTPERYLLYIPPGKGETRGMGCLTTIWSLFTVVITSFWVLIRGEGGNGPPLTVLIGFLGIFWAIGIVLLYVWLKLRFQRTLILLEPDRLVVQKALFLKRKQELALDPGSSAELRVAYSQNHSPVHCVAVCGQYGAVLTFGTALPPIDKQRFVSAINLFLRGPGYRPEGSVTWADGTMAVRPVQSLGESEAWSLLEALGIEVREVEGKRLLIESPAARLGPLRWLPIVSLGGFAFVWFSIFLVALTFTLVKEQDPDLLFKLLLAVPYLGFGLLMLVPIPLLLLGRVTIEVSPERIRCEAGWQWFRLGRDVAPGRVLRFRIIEKGKRSDKRRSQVRVPVCTAIAGSKELPLIVLSLDPRAADAVGTLVTAHLSRLGYTIPS